MDAYLQILSRHISDEKVKFFVEKALSQSKKINHLISDLLDVSKIESGKLILRPEEFDVKSLLEDTIELISHSMRASSLLYILIWSLLCCLVINIKSNR
jgi:signal transduction histidine kinase